MSETERKTKPGHTSILLRNVPDPMHTALKALAKQRGLCVKALILETCRKELINAKVLQE